MVARLLPLVLCLPMWCMAGVAQEPAAPARPEDTARRAAAKKLAEAQAALRAAIDAVADAQKALAAADDDESRQTASKRIEEARKRLEVARREVSTQNTEVLSAAAQAALVRRQLQRRGVPVEREHADPQDPFERFALLTPGGPLVVEVSLTIDGQPFRTARERLIEEMLAAADKDKDGKATWDEALSTPKFTAGRVRFADDRQKQAYVQSFDKNADGQADRSEVRQFVAQYFQGPAFVIGGGPYGRFAGGVVVVNGRLVNPGGLQVDVRTLLDTNADGVLDEQETAAVGQRLKSRDADDNDLVDSAEISGAPAARPALSAPFNGQLPQWAVLLGPAASSQELLTALQERYKNKNGRIVAASFAAIPGLFDALDKDQDGQLEEVEALALNDVSPQVELSVDLSTSGNAKGIALKRLADGIGRGKESAEAVLLELPGARVSLAANRTAPPTANFDQSAKMYLTRFDKNNNGYLEKDEVAGAFAQQFAQWDIDEDGKVFAAEITASYARMLAPQSSQVVVSIASQENSLFSALDTSGDGRLSLREMREVQQRIELLDTDRDGRISAAEIPATIVATFGLGSAGYRGYSAPPLPPRGKNYVAAPEWFTRMDRNGDGDLTLKEFLGREKTFDTLDANGDGFIEPKEAHAADSSP